MKNGELWFDILHWAAIGGLTVAVFGLVFIIVMIVVWQVLDYFD